MWEKFKVEDIKCVDDSTQARGVIILCGPRTMVTLMFDEKVPHKETDDLVHLLWGKLKLREVIVQSD